MTITQKIFSFSGRVNRMTFWFVAIGVFLVSLVLSNVVLPLMGIENMTDAEVEQMMNESEGSQSSGMEIEPMTEEEFLQFQAKVEKAQDSSATSTMRADEYEELTISNIAALIFWLVTSIIILWITLANSVKRLHDCNKSGWFLLINLLPFIGQLWILILCGFTKGTEEGNRFGEPEAA